MVSVRAVLKREFFFFWLLVVGCWLIWFVTLSGVEVSDFDFQFQSFSILYIPKNSQQNL